MRRIVNYKLYDTSTATFIFDYEDNDMDDLRRVYEELYRKKNGEYFLVCEGGPFSIYGEKYGNDYISTCNNVIPLTPDEAKAWAKKHMPEDEFEDEFGESDSEHDESNT